MKIVLAVGLTGGHIYPAIALAEHLGSADFKYLFVARSGSPLAKSLLQDRGFSVLELAVRGMPRGAGEALRHGVSFMAGQWRGMRLLKRAYQDWKPDLVIGFGSYVSFPAVLAAKCLGIKTMIFEPNAKMGVANWALGRIADKTVSVLMEKHAGIEPDKFVQAAPVLRKSVLEAVSVQERRAREALGLDPEGPPCVLIFGGSQGARAVNDAAFEALRSLSKKGKIFQALHVTGRADFERVSALYSRESHLRAVVKPYLEEMGLAYRAARTAVSRTGAITVSELGYFGLPSVLVPWGGSTEGHQMENARYLERFGIATIVPEGADLALRLESALEKTLGMVPAAGAAVFNGKPGLPEIVLQFLKEGRIA